MRTLPPFPVSTPFLERDPTSAPSAPGPAKTAPQMPRLPRPIKRWFQLVANLSVPEFANEKLTGNVDGTNTIFGIPTATPDPQYSLAIFNDATGLKISPTAYYLVAGPRVQFYVAPTGGPLYASYRY